MKGNAWRPDAVIWCGALLLRVVYLAQIHSTPAFSHLMGDGAGYDQWAQQLAGGDWLGREVFYQAPLYPYFLGVLYTIFGRDLWMVRVVQIVLGATACVFVAAAGRRFFPGKVGLVAGVLLAIYPPAIFFDGLIQKSALDLFFGSLLLLLLGEISERPRARLWLGAGVILGCNALTRENALVFVPVILAWLAIHFRGERKRWLWAGVMILGLLLVLLPVGLRNKFVGGEFHLTTSQFGTNLYIGNHAHATGAYEPLRWERSTPDLERRDATELAEAAHGRALKPAEVSGYWAGQAMEFIRSQPGAWLRLMARKWALVWNFAEMSDTEDFYTYRDCSRLLRILSPVLHFGVLCPLAVVGLCVTWKERRRLWLLYGLLFAYAASVALFYVFARYRYPLVSVLVLFAAAGLAGLRRERRLAGLIAAGIVAIGVNWELSPRQFMRATMRYNLGVSLFHDGQRDAAIEEISESVRLRPDYAPAQHLLAVAYLMNGQLREALPHFTETLRLKPDWGAAHGNYGLALARLGRHDEAIAAYKRALELDDNLPEVRSNLATESRDHHGGQ